jgi:hypothetical protein
VGASASDPLFCVEQEKTEKDIRIHSKVLLACIVVIVQWIINVERYKIFHGCGILIALGGTVPNGEQNTVVAQSGGETFFSACRHDLFLLITSLCIISR